MGKKRRTEENFVNIKKEKKEKKEASLVKKIAEGNRDYEEIFYARYYKIVYRYLLRNINHIQTAEDITQDVFVKALTKTHTYHGQNSEDDKKWLYRIAYTTFIDYKRKKNKYNQVFPIINDYTYENIVNGDSIIAPQNFYNPNVDSPSEALIAVDEYNALVSSLSIKEREIIDLVMIWEFDLKEISQILDINYATVRKKYSRALQKLRRIIKPKDKENMNKQKNRERIIKQIDGEKENRQEDEEKTNNQEDGGKIHE